MRLTLNLKIRVNIMYVRYSEVDIRVNFIRIVIIDEVLRGTESVPLNTIWTSRSVPLNTIWTHSRPISARYSLFRTNVNDNRIPSWNMFTSFEI